MNKVMLIGRLTKDSKIIKLQNSTRGAVKFRLAVNRNYSKDKDKKTDFIEIAYWSDHPCKMHEYLTKGKLVGVSGKIITGSYVDNNNIKKYFTMVQADTIKFLESKKEKAM
ncbi:single-stranded DNA-binding protein [Clostridium sp. P21]|uniref:Single-stranded DNA-binding protein n=1 Tax=Clostridium muellerianum TaxID=2716538 RepID=A0A7Y0EDK8_9CLOT|nr:single-stranded DNA-binding protein [Clostridium muellerianum]NMM61468.1 single-stranded DNA-binding protein [Clostridium muellerianum]